MILTIASFKGGVAKSTTAIHLAAYLQARGPTLLIDGDPNRSASGWARRGDLPFRVIDERQTARFAPEAKHIVIDTQARPSREDLEALVGAGDMLIVPTTPDAMALDALMLTVDALRGLGAERYRILLTMIPPRPSRDGDEARAMIVDAGLPIFAGGVRRIVAFQKASLQGVTVDAVRDPRAAEGWGDYEAIGRELLA